MNSSGNWVGGLILLILFLVAMATCQGDGNRCSSPQDEYTYDQCQEMRP